MTTRVRSSMCILGFSSEIGRNYHFFYQNILYRNCIFHYMFRCFFLVYLTIFCSQLTIKCLELRKKPRQGQEIWNTVTYIFWGLRERRLGFPVFYSSSRVLSSSDFVSLAAKFFMFKNIKTYTDPKKKCPLHIYLDFLQTIAFFFLFNYFASRNVII